MLKWFDAAECKLQGATSLGALGFRVLPIDALLDRVAENMPEQVDARRIAGYWLYRLLDIGMAVRRTVRVQDCFGDYTDDGVGIVQSELPMPKDASTLKHDAYRQFYTFDEALDCLRIERDCTREFRIKRFHGVIPFDEHLQVLPRVMAIISNDAVWEILQYLICKLYLTHCHVIAKISSDRAHWESVDMWGLYAHMCQQLGWPLDRVPVEITERWERMIDEMCTLGMFRMDNGNVRLGAGFFRQFSALRKRLEDTYHICFSD